MKARKYRIYPNKDQEKILSCHFGNARWIYNWGINEWKRRYEQGESCSWMSLSYEIPTLKQEAEWLKTSQANSLCLGLKNLGVAYSKFFTKSSGYPKYKKVVPKFDKQTINSYTYLSPFENHL